MPNDYSTGLTIFMCVMIACWSLGGCIMLADQNKQSVRNKDVCREAHFKQIKLETCGKREK